MRRLRPQGIDNNIYRWAGTRLSEAGKRRRSFMAASREVTERLSTAYRTGSPLVLLFDYDGTLTPIAERPSAALLAPAARRLLGELAAREGVCVGVMSGRGLGDLRHLVALPSLYYAGNSGLELDLQGHRVVHPEAKRYRAVVAEVVRGLGELTRDHPGSWVEDKGLGLTLHYRDVPHQRLKDLLEEAGRLLHSHSRVLRVVDAPMAWEVTPALDWDKGTALRRIMELAGDFAVPLYAGDRANDAPALEAANALGGVSLGVGPDAPPCARYRLREPADLLSLLAGLAAALGGGGGAGRERSTSRTTATATSLWTGG